MPSFGKQSAERLATCHKDLQVIMNEVIKLYDFSVLEGIRTTEQQQKYFAEGKSQLDGIKKKSNHQGKIDEVGNLVSYAVDIMPYKTGTNAFSGKITDNNRFYFLAGIVYAIAERLKSEGKITHSIRWGGDWDGDHQYDDENFMDLPHFEIVKKWGT